MLFSSLLQPIKQYQLKEKHILESGKFLKLDEMLPQMKERGEHYFIFYFTSDE